MSLHPPPQGKDPGSGRVLGNGDLMCFSVPVSMGSTGGVAKK